MKTRREKKHVKFFLNKLESPWSKQKLRVTHVDLRAIYQTTRRQGR